LYGALTNGDLPSREILANRFLDWGADPNTIRLERDMAPVYDVLFERPDLDFFITDRTGDTLWDRVWWHGLQA